MPVIRIDEDVWKELQSRAEPLVDIPNSVLRRILGLETKENEVVHDDNKVLDITLKDLHTPRTWSLIPFPKSKRSFFPGYKVWFRLETDVGLVETRVTSAPKGTPIEDPTAGTYIQGNLKPWYEYHRELSSGHKLRFERLDGELHYRLSILPRETRPSR
ncbi:hypothetical protein ACFLXE_04805 [Chloroflexota bacterium]